MSTYLLSFLIAFFYANDILAACGGTTRTWTATGTTTWATAANWSGSNVPDSATEDAVIQATGRTAVVGANYTLGCVDVQSGLLQGSATWTLDLKGDYFRAPIPNTLNFTNNGFVISLSGTSPQSFEAVDDIRDLRIANTTSVTLKNSFRILSDFIFATSGTTIIEGDVTVTNALTIPAGQTLVIKDGGSLTASQNLTVNGTIVVEAGGELKMANGRTLNITSSGSLTLDGASGIPAKVSSANASSFFTFTMAGTLNANYFIIQRTVATGLNISGTVSTLNNGEFRGIVNNGYGITLAAAASMPTTLSSIGFFNDDAVANPRNINAVAYPGAVITVNNYSGSVGGPTRENDTGNRITWGTAAGTELSITDDAETNEPTATLAASTTVTFAEFAFTLTQASTATNITEVTFTMTGTANVSDLASVQVFRDATGTPNCNFDAATDVQIGSNLVFSGSPPRATVTIPSGVVQTNSSTQQACLHIRARTTANPTDQRTVKFGIISASDVVNSQNYAMSATSGTPIESNQSILVNANNSVWTGATNNNWNTTTNWLSTTIPTATRDCTIGVGTRIPLVNITPVLCGNATLSTGGTLNFNSTTNTYEVYSTLDVSTGFTFQNAASANISMRGTNNQILKLGSAFPGNLIINNSGVTNSDNVSLGLNSTVNGNLTCTNGVLKIPNGLTLTVLGNIVIQTGCAITVEPGGTLALGNNRTLTVNAGGILNLVGTSGLKALVTSDSVSSSYSVIVNGEINARNYTFNRLGVNGVSIESGATINATNFLQDGSFVYPVNSNTTFLKLKRQIPGNTLTGMYFDKNSSPATTITNIDTTGASAGTLSISSYSGDLGGPSFDIDPTYVVSWSGQTNTILITQEATSPGTVSVGQTANMGRFGFRQSQAGASYSDTDVTTLGLSLTGTGNATDITNVKLYFDSGCTGSGGTLIGTGSYSGSPAKVTFILSPGVLTVPSSLTAPAKVCVYVTYDIDATANNGNTVGARIASASDFVNSLNYSISSSTPAPVTLGTSSTINAPTTTTWTGTTSTNWSVATNWTDGVPSSTKSCVIANVANDPIISSGTAVCKNLTITNGILALNTGAQLDIYGDFTNSGTFTQVGNLYIKDGGTNINHTISSNSTLINLNIDKTGTGLVNIDHSNQIINSLSLTSSTTIEIASGKKLVLPNGMTLTTGTLKIYGGGILEIGNGQTFTVAGGNFTISGTNEVFPQNQATKGRVQVQGGAGSFGFTSSSGNIDLTGFQFDRLNTNGIVVGGSTNLLNLRGGQLTNLSTSYASVIGIQINNSGSKPVAASNIAWVWGNFNSFTVNGGTPQNTDNYRLISSSGCNGGSMDFTGWTGDWFEARTTFNVATKVSTINCTITMGEAASAVTLLSFTATPYNGAVDVKWETNMERDHFGFNVYRKNGPTGKFQQINRTLIRNIINSGSNRGKYRFLDQDVTNGVRYYYYLEDVDLSGIRNFNGPVFATPLASLGAAPADQSDENAQTNPNDADDGGATSPAPIPNPNYQDLGNGVIIIDKTSTTMRLEINPAVPSFSVSSWDGGYKDVQIAGYSKMTEVGKPELPEKDLLIEVASNITTASISNIAITENLLTSHLISPSPSYSLNGSGVLVPNYTPETTTYSTNANFPNQFVTVNSSIVSGASKKFLKIKINPLKHNPVGNSISHATKIILDIALDGNDWDVTAPTVSSQLTPYSIANTLKIDINSTGFYEITYSDMLSSQVEGPFKNTTMSNWRLYYDNKELPLELNSANGTFQSGDSIKFYAVAKSNLDSRKTHLILSPVALKGEVGLSERIANFNADPVDQIISTENIIRKNITLEQNRYFIDGITLGDNLDHYFYGNLVSFPGMEQLDVSTTLADVDLNSSENVTIKYHIRGRNGIRDTAIKHHVGFYLNGVEEGTAIFEENQRMTLTFEVPADRINVGSNTLRFRVLGTFAPVGDYDQVLVDKIEISYNSYRYGGTGQNNFNVLDIGKVQTISNFSSSSLAAYDITNSDTPLKLSNTLIASHDTGVTYQISFYADDNVNQDNSKNYVILPSSAYFKPIALSLNSGLSHSLKSSDNSADLIIIGRDEMIEAAQELIRHRESQGLIVKALTPEQIFGEFSFGISKSQAIRDFISTAMNIWTKKPRYLLVLGDGSLDPLDHNVSTLASNRRSILEVGTLPMPMLSGRFIDFGTDHFYVSTEQSHMPLLSIGRLPTNSPDILKNYVDKVIRYELGTSSPLINMKKIAFFADEDTGLYENFTSLSQSMISVVPNFSTSFYDRTDLGSDASTKTRLIEEFVSSPLMISMIGHGAFDRFGNDILSVTDARSLNNLRYPIVLTWNCESAYYFDANNSYKSLGEELIFNNNGGAIAYLGSTTQTTPPAQSKLAQALFSQLSSSVSRPWDGSRLGDLLYQAKLSVGSGSYERDIVNSFIILGDPSLKMPEEIYSPAIVQAPSTSTKSKKSFFGCSANASTNGAHNSNDWLFGLLEAILYLSAMLFGARYTFKKS